MKVLLVDDSRTMRNIQRKALSTGFDSFEFVEAEDGLDALSQIAAAGPVDLILLDWNMPNMNGLEFLVKFRQDNKTTPVIMVTTEAEKPAVIKALKAGVNNYLIKPFPPDKLIEIVKKTLEKCGVAIS